MLPLPRRLGDGPYAEFSSMWPVHPTSLQRERRRTLSGHRHGLWGVARLARCGGPGPCRPASSRSSRPTTGGRQTLYFRTSRGVTTPDRRIALQPDRVVTIAPAAAAVPSCAG